MYNFFRQKIRQSNFVHRFNCKFEKKKLITIDHAYEFPKSIACFEKLADAQKLKKINYVNNELTNPRLLENKWKMLNFD